MPDFSEINEKGLWTYRGRVGRTVHIHYIYRNASLKKSKGSHLFNKMYTNFI